MISTDPASCSRLVTTPASAPTLFEPVIVAAKEIACGGKLSRIDERAIIKKICAAVSALFKQWRIEGGAP
jgi:hypothetical protein